MSNNQIMTYDDNRSAVAAMQSATTEMVVSRQAQEVQAAMIVAKRFPRDETASWNRIMTACKRPGLAENARYEYPRGGENVTGPSIRLAEAMAQAWGNLDFGVIELDQKIGESTVMAYCWDLETNTRQTKIFTVPHIRQTKKGAKTLTDPRDIYEMVANQGARRLRACILGIIPKDVVDDALDQCTQTLTSGKEPLIDRVRKMVAVFHEKLGVPQSCLEEYIGCKVEAFTEQSIIRLRGVYTAITEGRADREDYFNLPKVEAQSEPENTTKSATTAEKSAAISSEQQDLPIEDTTGLVSDEEQVSLNDI